MGKGDVERLNTTLCSYMSNIHETLQMLDQTPASSLQKVSWDDVVKMGDQLSKQATTAGMLFTGEKTEVKALVENMEAYFNVLQGLLLLAYGSTLGAGPTLSSNIHASIRQAVDCSFMLWRECVSSYGPRKEQKRTVPQLVGTVWEACSNLKKTPANNIVAIGRGMTQVAVSVKDVLREIRELKPCSSDPTLAVSDERGEAESQDMKSATSELDNDEDDLGKDLSPEEMKIAQLAIRVVSEALVVIKDLIRSVTGLLKKEKLKDENDGVQSLEKLLKLCCGVGAQVDELGACLYPPQELSTIATACKEISNLTDGVGKELDSLSGSAEAFSDRCKGLENALDMLRLEINSSSAAATGADPKSSSTEDIVAEMKNLAVRN